MSPAGRPPLSGETKGRFLQIRISEEEKAVLDAAAAIAGQPTATWLRELGLAAAAEQTAKPAPKKKAAKKAGQ